MQENNSMIDNKRENDIEYGSVDKDTWYKEHVLSEEQLDLLIKNKFNRYKHCLNSNMLLKD